MISELICELSNMGVQRMLDWGEHIQCSLRTLTYSREHERLVAIVGPPPPYIMQKDLMNGRGDIHRALMMLPLNNMETADLKARP